MGFKTKSNNINQSNICIPFQVGGLIFNSEADYQLFKDIDRMIVMIFKLITFYVTSFFIKKK